MDTRAITVTRSNWSFNISRVECSRLNQLHGRRSAAELKEALVSIAARFFGVAPEVLMKTPSANRWINRILDRNLHPLDAAQAIFNLENPLTQELLGFLDVPNTSFFRDNQHEVFCQVFDEIFANRSAGEPLRIWVPGCSRGHEVYSLAMTLHRKGYHEKAKIEILGTDILEKSIRIARGGQYFHLDEREDLPLYAETRELIHRTFRGYFEEHPETHYYQVRPEIMPMVSFALDNITYSNVQGPFDVISCHSLLMHLERAASRRARKHMIDNLKSGGYIVSSENNFRGLDPEILQAVTPRSAVSVAYRLATAR